MATRFRVIASASQQQSGSHGPKKQNARRFSPVVQKRIDLIKEDIKSVYDQRVASINAVDVSMRDIVTKEVELRQQIIDKWVAIAKEDIDNLMQKCNTKKHGEAAHVVEGEVVDDVIDHTVVTPPPAAEAFYEPWVKDD